MTEGSKIRSSVTTDRMAKLVLILTLILTSVPLFGAEDFYQLELRAGKVDFDANRVRRAVDEFRIAAFGFLDRPPLLIEALVRLAVAQNAAGMPDRVSDTLSRFVDIEQRFPVYGSLQIEDPVKSKFEAIALQGVRRATLQAIPDLAPLANYEFLRIAQLPQSQRMSAYEAGAQREPQNPEWPLALARESAERGSQNDVIRWAKKVLEIDHENKDAQALLVHAYVARRQCREADPLLKNLTVADFQKHPDLYADDAVCLADAKQWSEAQAALAKVPEKLRERPDVVAAQDRIVRATKPEQKSSLVPKSSDVLETAERLVHEGRYRDALRNLQSAETKDPKNRALHLEILEAAVLAKDWNVARPQVNLVAPFASGEELYMFYASVALYESGQKDAAKEYMERARPRMVSSPMVDYYLKAVLGSAD